LNAAADGVAIVPDLTLCGDIKLNPRVRLHRGKGRLTSPGHCPWYGSPSGEAVAPNILGARASFVGLLRELDLKKQPDRETLDLIEMRRQLTALRSQHSDSLPIASVLNRFLVKIAFLTEPTDLAHEEYLRSEFERTLTRVKEIRAGTKSG